MIKSWGRGIERIFEACRVAKCPKPQFRPDHSGLWVEFQFPKTTVETTVKTHSLILEYLEKKLKATLAEVAFGINKSLRAVERAASRLVKENKLRFIGSRKGGHWEVLK
jgi:ATP-dependent DNA helicase RecG